MSIPMKQSTPPPATIEDVITRGDLSKLTAEQRTEYYIKLCARHGLDPLTQPLDWLTLNGKLTLYANRRCADQLRKINGISIELVSQEEAHNLYTVHVRAKDKDGRLDEDLGVVALSDQLKGEARANTILKGITKAKRRVTLSISGLGYLDETEVEDIPAAAKAPVVLPPPTTFSSEHKSMEPKPSRSVQDPGDPREIVLGDSPDWVWFGQQMIAVASTPQWPDWDEANRTNIARMENEAPKVHVRMIAAIKKANAGTPGHKA